MTNTKALFVLAGSILSLAAPAMADQTAVSRDEVRAIVAEMLSDAETRSSLLQGGGTAGHDDRGFFLASSDGNYRLNVGGFVQMRYIASFRDDEGADGTGTGQNNEFQPGFAIQRARLEFTGNIVSPDLKFAVTEEFSSGQAGTAELKDAWFDYSFGNGFYVKGGQFKLGFLREEQISDIYQLTVERSQVNSLFTQDRSQGVEIGYRDEQFRAMFSVNDGLNSDNTPFSTGAAGGATTNQADYGLTFRAEYNFMGSVKTLKDFTSMPDGETAAMIGAAVHFQQSPNTILNTDVDTNYLSYTVDAQFESAGFNAFAAFVGSNTRQRPDTVTPSEDREANDFGVVVQAGYRFGNWEPFARYDGIFLDDDAQTGRTNIAASGDDNLNFLTGGVNYYWANHAAKVTVDFVYAFERTDQIANFPGAGASIPVGLGRNYVGNSTGILSSAEDGSAALRVQFQLVF